MSTPQALFSLVQQLQQELQNQRVEIQALRADIHRLQNQPDRPSRSLLPDPPRFDGKPYTLRTWLPSIRAKLRADQLTGVRAFDYVWDRLEQPQQASVLHLRHSSEQSQSWDPESLFSFFQRLCHNPRERQEAVQRLTLIRQRDEESLIAFLARFERLVYEAKALEWPETTRIATLHRGLRSSLRQSLEESNDSLFSLSYDAYIELIQSFDRRARRPQAQSSQPVHQSVRQPVPKPRQSVPESMEIDAISHQSHSRSSSASSAHRHNLRADNNLCFYCGSPNHWISACPRQPSPPVSRPDSPRPRRTKQTAKSEFLNRMHYARTHGLPDPVPSP